MTYCNSSEYVSIRDKIKVILTTDFKDDRNITRSLTEKEIEIQTLINSVYDKLELIYVKMCKMLGSVKIINTRMNQYENQYDIYKSKDNQEAKESTNKRLTTYNDNSREDNYVTIHYIRMLLLFMLVLMGGYIIYKGKWRERKVIIFYMVLLGIYFSPIRKIITQVFNIYDDRYKIRRSIERST